MESGNNMLYREDYGEGFTKKGGSKSVPGPG